MKRKGIMSISLFLTLFLTSWAAELFYFRAIEPAQNLEEEEALFIEMTPTIYRPMLDEREYVRIISP
ncbi:hypothetical protein [Salsuginibacillus kocurii]|uniref:hypothetical protein n=1 Tax=Salsuginibacillus kocurii TaxID=427078 RepID=UPI00036C795C|nr:hypothetical protein [Salsuginibacillus kocurii]